MKRGMSWGNYPPAQSAMVPVIWPDEDFPVCDEMPGRTGAGILPYGNGRSYGDVCLNDGGALADIRGLNRFISFDPMTGVLACEAGVTLGEILRLTVPQGWFLGVTPGTQFVTVGGAIANDVHGKNHHRAGSFGHHLLGFELLRSDSGRRHCGPNKNNALFRSTIGGLGMTGIILTAKIQLRRIPSAAVIAEDIRFGSLAEFFSLSEASDKGYEYTVAWVDCTATGVKSGRGIFSRGNHAPAGAAARVTARSRRRNIPFMPPLSLVNRLGVKLFNALYFHRAPKIPRPVAKSYVPFFYPLDGIGNWNRLYGRQGFFQYQCAVPPKDAEAVIGRLLQRIARSGQGSMLAVLKLFGDKKPVGQMSFPRPGATLALDFPNRGLRTLRLLDALDAIVDEAGGAVYAAKDARMKGESFRRAFPGWRAVEAHRDPAISSSFWRRVTGDQ